MTAIESRSNAFLSDHETRVDLLNSEAIAATIVALLRERPDRPVTIGVHGDWGAGKSSVLEMIEAALQNEQGVLCIKFNAWRFQGFEDAKIALMEGIVTGLIEKRPGLTKTSIVKNVLRRIKWLKIAKKVSTVGLNVAGIPLSFNEGGRGKSVSEEINAFRKAFEKLLKDTGIEQLVVLLDDLDRCLPDTAIETLEAVRLFVFTSRTAFVVAADEAMIEYSVRKHFPELPETTGPQTYARNYLEKLIQVPFRIPTLGETETRIYVTLLLMGAELGEDSPVFSKLINAARERLKRPWENVALDAAAVRAVLGDKAAQSQNTLTLSDQIGPILASGTKGNPRQIKRFLNMLMLRKRTADARGFGDEVKLPVLAKLMLAERFLPRLFDQIATAAATSPTGKCDELATLEDADKEQADVKSESASKSVSRSKAIDGKDIANLSVVKSTERTVLAEWVSSKPIRAWAAINPALAGIDLRPYLFVTKDRKDYFGAASVLGHLTTIIEHLLGPKITVQALETDLRRLAPPEAEKVFDAVRERVIGSDEFDREPPGVAGLVVLVKAHPMLQANLIDFLEGLPVDHLGPWAVKGWEGVIREVELVARLDRLIGSWATSSKNALLKAAAAATRKIVQGGR